MTVAHIHLESPVTANTSLFHYTTPRYMRLRKYSVIVIITSYSVWQSCTFIWTLQSLATVGCFTIPHSAVHAFVAIVQESRETITAQTCCRRGRVQKRRAWFEERTCRSALFAQHKQPGGSVASLLWSLFLSPNMCIHLPTCKSKLHASSVCSNSNHLRTLSINLCVLWFFYTHFKMSCFH